MGFTRTWNWNGSELTLDVLRQLVADCDAQGLSNDTKVKVEVTTYNDPRESGKTIYLSVTA